MSAPVISWVVNGTLFTSSENGIMLRPTVTSDTTSTSVLQFDPLTAMHEGDYICRADLGGTDSSYMYLIAVQSK